MQAAADVRYLDLDGDGVPDAVLTVAHLSDECGDTAAPTVVETLESGIGVDGRPRDIHVHAHA
jgi:hypothetical protein